ncbi:LUD domain-containing protein [Nocardiopsis sp. EMB25]|uniref:LutC/YkgG family protein n=1 Tax=Nocardiopsis sp. EMB25 TaxID=2835867 RepID=UPI002283A78E|nr:LUD domain-containing protein [Nocardiopsis sp. EMB25]MCY9784335.1 LUD domain-containing protein [Nocardiopsis sp. EMB25]
MSAREEILARIRAANGAAQATDTEVPRAYRRSDGRPPGHPELLDLLEDRLVDYRAAVHRCGPEEVAATVEGVLTEALGPDRAEVLAAPGLPGTWTPSGAGRDDGRPAVRLSECGAAVTGTAVAIAQTGTLVLDAGAVCGRRALSLLPDVCVCVVRADQVVGGVPEALERLDPLAPLTFVSGPSATSDIELERVEGVHGPRTLHVVLVASA